VAVKLKSVSVQCRTERTFSLWKALMSFDFSRCQDVEQSSCWGLKPAKTLETIDDLACDVAQYQR
jgi:hypothetical protein